MIHEISGLDNIKNDVRGALKMEHDAKAFHSFEFNEKSHRVAVLIPCFNEEQTVGKVITDFRNELPTAKIYVYDNNSTDNTALVAKKAGAIVMGEKRQGKGFVVASMFEEIDADVYVLVDGDDTYPADRVNDLIIPIIKDEADMMVGTRLTDYGDKSFRAFHFFGNRLVVNLVNFLFGSKLSDIMSGYRAFNSKFVKSIPIVSRTFELETQMTLQALFYNYVIGEKPISYGKRPDGSHSKLNTFSDGFKVILTIFDIFKAYRPLLFFFLISALFFFTGLLVGSIPVIEFVSTGKIDHFPSAILASGIMILSFLFLAVGIILDGFNHRLRELFRVVTLRQSYTRPDIQSKKKIL